jgi:hypothetical protein
MAVRHFYAFLILAVMLWLAIEVILQAQSGGGL